MGVIFESKDFENSFATSLAEHLELVNGVLQSKLSERTLS